MAKFQKGKSGNPGGRPKEDNELKRLAKEYTAEATERLAFWMRSDHPKASPAASIALLERAWGKPQQDVSLTHDVSDAFVKIWQAVSDGTVAGSVAEESRQPASVRH